MRIEFDPEADALYIRFSDDKPTENLDVQNGITIDLDQHKRVTGIEILDVSRRFPPDALASVTVQNLLKAA